MVLSDSLSGASVYAGSCTDRGIEPDDNSCVLSAISFSFFSNSSVCVRAHAQTSAPCSAKTLSQVLLAQLVSRYMIKAKRGSIVNIASISGIEGKQGSLAYGSSKAAVMF